MGRAEKESPGHLGHLRSAVDWFRQELELRGWVKPPSAGADLDGGDGVEGGDSGAGDRMSPDRTPSPRPRSRLTRLLSAIDDPSVAADAGAQPADDEVVAATSLLPPTVCAELTGHGGMSGRVASASDAAHAVAASPAQAPMRQLLASPDDGAWRSREAYGTSEGTPRGRGPPQRGDDLSAEERWLLSRCPVEHVVLGWANMHLAAATLRGRVRRAPTGLAVASHDCPAARVRPCSHFPFACATSRSPLATEPASRRCSCSCGARGCCHGRLQTAVTRANLVPTRSSSRRRRWSARPTHFAGVPSLWLQCVRREGLHLPRPTAQRG